MNSDLYKLKVRLSPILKKKKSGVKQVNVYLMALLRDSDSLEVASSITCCLSSSSKISAIDLAVTSIPSRRKEEKTKNAC